MGQAGFLTPRIWREAPYEVCLQEMRQFTMDRGPDTPDELWLVEHPPVFTLGLAADQSHILQAGLIPVIQTDRGGEVTFHGPGQLVVYPLINLKRQGLYVKELVYRIEQSIIDLLNRYGLTSAHRIAGAPGIYLQHDMALSNKHMGLSPMTGQSKIAALGLKIKNGCSYHGYAINIDMDLQPFKQINPCGYPGLQTTDLATMGVHKSWAEVAADATQCLRLALTTTP
ncbi:MAG: lipoyl(octanoyl) transferase LipB [Burkholderiaceae bacterium]